MFHDLVRLLGFFNIFLSLVAVLFAPVLLVWAMNRGASGWDEAATRALTLGLLLFLFFVLLLFSGLGLVRRRPWSRKLTLAVGGLMLATGIWHAFRAEWGYALFCAAYAALVAWLLLHPVNRDYFSEEPSDL